MEQNYEHDYSVKDIYNYLKKINLECPICGKTGWDILGDVEKYDIVKENDNDEDQVCEVIKLHCKHCGYIMEFSAKSFYDESSRKTLKRILKGKGLI